MVPGELMSTLQIAFKEYISPFKSEPYLSDPTIERIVRHIEHVVENIIVLADSLELSQNEKNIAVITALFHDIGRLWLQHPENAESNIKDHAEASIQYLKSSAIFEQLDEISQNIVIQVIIHHNKADLPKKENEAILFYIKLLRDADKLDAWRSTSEYLTRKGLKPIIATELLLSDRPVVTPELCKIIIEGGIPHKGELVTFNDFIIFQMSWIFDLHFKKSFQIVNQKQYIRHLYDALPKNDSVIEIYRMIRIHIENQV